MDRGDEPVDNPEEARRLRAQARRVYAESVVGATVLTGISLLAAVGMGG
jgi:hypothetical protein